MKTETAVNNNKVLLRRYEDDLNVGGLGVIVLGAWSVVKAIMQLFTMIKSSALELEADDELTQTLGVILFTVIFLLVLLLIMQVHLYVGLNAMKAARGQKHKRGYVVWAVIALALQFLSYISYGNMFKDIANIDTTLASLLVDITMTYTFFIVVRSAHRIKKLKASEAGE